MLRRCAATWAGVLALAGLLAACGSTAATSSSPTPTVPPLSSSFEQVSSAVPHHVAAINLSWINAHQGWALATTPSCTGKGCVAVLGTRDGGRVWTQLAHLRACSSTCTLVGEEQVSAITFASPEIGYIYGALGVSPLMMTTDGGQAWRVEAGRDTAALALAGTVVIRVSSSGVGCPGPCDWSIDEAALASRSWTSVATPATDNHYSAQLLVQGSDVYALFPGSLAQGSGTQQGSLYVSLDGGAAWVERADPCGYTGSMPDDAQEMAAAPNGVLAVLCEPRVDEGSGFFVIVSTDAGVLFGNREPIPVDWGQQLAATSATKLYVGNNDVVGQGSYVYKLISSSNGGQTWTTVVNFRGRVGQTASAYLGFKGRADGHWIAPSSTLWSTTNAGDSWSKSSF
jgi:photosystem II stability/assembly factor-like uncharacterized protein